MLLPAICIPVVLGGFEDGTELGLFVALVTVHAVTLSLGHDHEPCAAADDRASCPPHPPARGSRCPLTVAGRSGTAA